MSLKTPARIRKAFIARGEAISDWAKERGFTPQQVHEVLSGRCKGHRGKAHHIAVALGLKRHG